MRNLFSILAVLIVFTSSVFANNNNEDKKPKKTFSVTGKVKDASESLTGVKVILDGKENIVYTDFDGNFSIENVVEGDHTVSFSLVTYDNKEIVFNPKNSSNLVIELEAK